MAIDDTTRLTCLEVLPDEKRQPWWGFFSGPLPCSIARELAAGRFYPITAVHTVLNSGKKPFQR